MRRIDSTTAGLEGGGRWSGDKEGRQPLKGEKDKKMLSHTEASNTLIPKPDQKNYKKNKKITRKQINKENRQNKITRKKTKSKNKTDQYL